jgi:hypothetical protein
MQIFTISLIIIYIVIAGGIFMKLPKRAKSIIVVIAVLALFFTTAFATTSVAERDIVYGVRVSVNGVVQEFDHDMRPFIMDARTFLPVRGIAEAFGINVCFDPNMNMVYVTNAALPSMLAHDVVGRWSVYFAEVGEFGHFFSPDGTGYQWGPGFTIQFRWSADQNRLNINPIVFGEVSDIPTQYLWEIGDTDPDTGRRHDHGVLVLSDGEHGTGIMLVLGRVPITQVTTEQTTSGTLFYGVRVAVNGVIQEFAHDMRPFIMEGRTFLPVRGIADALGLEVDFDGAANMVLLSERTAQAGRPPEPAGEPLPTRTSHFVGKWSSAAITYIFYPDGRGRRGSTEINEEFSWSPFRDGRLRLTIGGSATMYNYTITGNVLNITNGDFPALSRDTTGQTASDLIGTWSRPPLLAQGFTFNADGTGHHRIDDVLSPFTWTITEPGMVRMVFAAGGFVMPGTENHFFVVEGNALSLLRYEPPWNIRGTYVRQ